MTTAKRFGTFGGVFTPSILTILGVIMYMRLPMIVGEAGLFGTLGIIFIAHLISITTGLSVSSIATDKKVKEGGTYYIISRSLGLPIGGTLGLALFVGLSFAVSLYLIGFSESFLGYFNLPMDIRSIRITGSIILLVVTIITFISASLAIKAQYLIMIAMGLSLLSILMGRHDMAPSSPNFFGQGTGIPLMVLFGIFFPAVTGFEAGVSMSGDLKNPNRSIPRGTISAIIIGLVVYIILAFFYSYKVDAGLLATDPRALFKIALVPELVIAGIWGATLSSALGSILAAPRILQSTAIDRITPRIFSRGAGVANEPRNALLLTFLIAEAGILIGELNVIARIVSIFFITTYGFLNLSAAFERITSPDFRPSFKTPAWVSILGSVACFIVMIQLDFLAMIAGVVILGLLFVVLKRRQLVLETGDTWSSVWATMVRTGLRRLKKSSENTRNWRPNIILFCGQDTARPHLVEMAKAFSGRLGMFSAFELVESREPRLIKDQRYFSASGKKDEFLIHQHKCRNIYEGMDEIARVYGFSGIEPNTILMGWSKNAKNKEQFLHLIQGFKESNFNSILLNYNTSKKFGEKKTIDVWWSGKGRNLIFSTFLLRHFTSEGDWKDARIRVMVINNVRARTESLHKILQQILTRYRITMEIKIIDNSADGLPAKDVICRESGASDLTLIGLPDLEYQNIDRVFDNVLTLSQHLGTFLLVNSSSHFESFDLGMEPQPDAGRTILPPQDPDLPAVEAPPYPVVQEDIAKMDIHGRQMHALFFEKTFIPVFQDLEKLAGEIHSAIQKVFDQIDQLGDLPDAYRRTKTLIKISNDFYFRTSRIFTDLISRKLDLQKSTLDSGINWYINQLDQALLQFPARIEIPYETKDLAIRKKDPFLLKWFKFRRRITHLRPGATWMAKIHYQEIAAYYLRNNQHVFLSDFLEQFQNDLFNQLSESHALTISVDELLETLLKKASNKDEFLDAVIKHRRIIEDKVAASSEGIKKRTEQEQRRLLAEFHKNLQRMSNDLGKADVNFRIRRKRGKRNHYEKLIQENAGFAETWYDQTLLQVNKIHLDLLVQSYRNRVKDKINELYLSINQQLNNRYCLELKKVRSKLEKFSGNVNELTGLKKRIQAINNDLTFLQDFDTLGDEVLKLTELLPESIVIPSGGSAEAQTDESPEPQEVPLRKITRFYIESGFLGTIHDQLEESTEKLKGPILTIQDLLTLTYFNLQNIPDDLSDKTRVIVSIVEEASEKIQNEEEKIRREEEHIINGIDRSLQEVFGQLTVYRIPLTLSNYSRFLRQPQGKTVRKKVDIYLERLNQAFRRLLAKVLYSRSEGILLARKITETGPGVEGTQRIIDLAEQVRPKDKVLEKLPQFYKNLYSGRSSINEDFWIRREKEEQMFRIAVMRHHSGYGGGILILGERNAGKTTFCKNMAAKLLSSEQVYHLFPVPEGSCQVSEFTAELEKVTRTQGSVEEILSSLSSDSVLMIHDLELWWERSVQGWEVVKLLKRMINDYGRKVLFVVNMNPFTYDLMQRMVKLQEAFISIITLSPFDALDLKEMIIRRHHSSGLKFVLNKTDEEELSEIRMASLFNAYFDYSEGNPGMALKAWLANITGVFGQRIHIRPPRLPDMSRLSQLDEDWKLVLINMILQKRMDCDKMARIFHMDSVRAKDIIISMERVGLIEERNENLYNVNTYLEPHLVRAFKKEGFV
ncbi:MAG TPA: hypothetical protein PKH94_01985 [Bacteroidales bacterium]|nr:hypothetical protein [Bacteroidales bacterium]HNS45989.1 hypothetical protein [Bacteroidales bacterium]